MIDSAGLNDAIDLFGTELNKRGAEIDSFWVDDGWDYLRAPQVASDDDLEVWDFDPTQFPDGFAPQKQLTSKYDASLSVWMSPFGGYGESASRRLQFNASKPADQQLETHGGNAFKLSGDKYYQRFRSVIFDMLDNQGVQGFKFDGIGGGLFQTGANPSYIPDYEALLQLLTEMREHSSDVFVNATVGTWHSPYWLMYADSLWRDGQDAYLAGQGNVRQQYINYRDQMSYEHTVKTTPLFPVTALMNHGFIFSERTPQFDANYDLTDPEVRKNVAADLRDYFGMGFSLQELYVRHTQVEPDQPGADWFWDTVAENAKWARQNLGLLTDTHWIGGNPAHGEVYGTAAWQPDGDSERGVVMLRNASTKPQSFALDVGKAFELPDGAHGTYAFSARDGLYDDFVATAGTDYHVTLQPFEVVLLEATPSDEPPTDSEPLPGNNAIDRSSWSVSADSEETSGEDSPATNAIDGDPATMWHTGYTDGIDPLPHQITIDTGAGHVAEVGSLEYLPRQDARDGNGTIKGYKVYTSLDGENWTNVAEGELDPTGELATIELEPTFARYVRLEATSTSKNGVYSEDSGYASAAEINLYPAASDALDATDFTVTADSQEQQGEDGSAKNAIDSDPNTYWHTAYTSGDAQQEAMPHELVVDMHETNAITGFDYVPRTDVPGANGTIKGYEFYTSTDGNDWTKAASGDFDPTGQAAHIDFDPVSARYVKLVATSSANGARFAGAAELRLYGQGDEAVVIDQLPEVDSVEVAYGTSEADAIAALPAEAEIVDSAGQTHQVSLRWSIADYDGATAGSYSALASFDLPEGVEQSDPPVELKVSTTVEVAAEENEADAQSGTDEANGTDEADGTDEASGTDGADGTDEGTDAADDGDETNAAADGQNASAVADASAEGSSNGADSAAEGSDGQDAGSEQAQAAAHSDSSADGDQAQAHADSHGSAASGSQGAASEGVSDTAGSSASSGAESGSQGSEGSQSSTGSQASAGSQAGSEAQASTGSQASAGSQASVDSQASADPGDEGDLARTGTTPLPLVALAVGLLAVGFVVVRRRSRLQH